MLPSPLNLNLVPRTTLWRISNLLSEVEGRMARWRPSMEAALCAVRTEHQNSVPADDELEFEG